MVRVSHVAPPDTALTPAVRAAFPGPRLAEFRAAHDRLAKAGYGVAVPRSFQQVAPIVATALNTDQALGLAPAASRLAVGTAPRTAAVFLDLAVPMARRLRTPQGFSAWVALILSMIKPAPESIAPLLARAEMLVERLGLDALSAWVQTGLRLGAGDAVKRERFFSLDMAEAQRLLERYAGEDTFQSLEGELRAFHRVLWGRMPPLREALPLGRGHAALRASFGAGVVQLPASFSGHRGRERAVYKAALAHIGAHMAYGGPRYRVGQLKPLQIAVVSLIEDARVEYLARREMPGLARLWLPFHTVDPDGMATTPSLFARLARALIDPDFPIKHHWVQKGVTMFRDGMGQIENPALSRHIGNILGNDLGQTRVQFNARNYVVQPAYRDDNLGLWALPPDTDAPTQQHQIEITTQDLHKSQLSDAPQQRKQSHPKDQQPDTGAEAVSAAPATPEAGRVVAHVPEYDHVTGSERRDWVTVKAYEPGPGDPLFWRKLEERHGGLLARIGALVRAASVGRARRLKRQGEGETLDLDAAIEAAINLRSGQTPDPRVYEGVSPLERSIAVHLLLDISQSTDDAVFPGGPKVISLLRDASALLAHAMDTLGDPLAITAFASDGREDLRVVPVKRFGDALTPLTGMALSGLSAGYSTRIGAAIRYAGQQLEDVPCHRRLLLVVTDGEPSDIDVPDPEYLAQDAKRAVQSLNARGMDTFCIALGQAAGQRHSEIFSRRGFLQLDRLEALPEKLPALYLRMTR